MVMLVDGVALRPYLPADGYFFFDGDVTPAVWCGFRTGVVADATAFIVLD